MSSKHAFVTGGGTGIGLACARRLSADGYRVTISGRNEKRLAESGFDYVVMDVTDEDSVHQAFDQVDLVDVLVNNAGEAETAPLLKTSLKMWQSMLDVNLTGAFLCAKAAIPQMIDRGQGRFIVIASTASLVGYSYTGAYTSAKHGVLGLVKTLALELAKTGVTANAVCPGFTRTEMLDRSIENIVKKTGCSSEEALQKLVQGNPMQRPVEAEEVADAVSWLASDGASSVNGTSIPIDGGEVIS